MHKVCLIAFIFQKSNWASSRLTRRTSHLFLLRSLFSLKCWGLILSKMGQSDFCSQKEFILDSLPQLPSLNVSHVRAGGTLQGARLLGESCPHHLPLKLQTNHHSFIQKKAVSSQESRGPRSQTPLPSFLAPTHHSSQGAYNPGCWVQVDPKSQNHCLSFILRDSVLVAPRAHPFNPQNQVLDSDLFLQCVSPTSQGVQGSSTGESLSEAKVSTWRSRRCRWFANITL